MKNKFKALFVYPSGKITFKNITKDDLMEGDVLVKIFYTSINFKDGLALKKDNNIIKKYPMIPGSDFSGIVVQSTHKRFKSGDKVVCNGWGIGEKHFGGFSNFARVNGDWLIHLPQMITLKESMIIGAAGYTAALCVQELKKKINPKKGPIIVTGASGGVGSITVYLLSKLKYDVTALSSKDSSFLNSIGANKIIKRKDYIINNKLLSKKRWAGSIDTVGGEILSNIISEMHYNGLVVSTGLAASYKLNTTVYPFILRNITLSGIDCVYASYKKRVSAWSFLNKHISKNFLQKIVNNYEFDDIVKVTKKILQGKIKGRALIKI